MARIKVATASTPGIFNAATLSVASTKSISHMLQRVECIDLFHIHEIDVKGCIVSHAARDGLLSNICDLYWQNALIVGRR